MAEKITSVNPRILTWARTVSGTTLQEAQEHFGIDKLNAWENGELFPTAAELRKISDYYRKPVAVFFFPEPPEYKDIPASCRTLPVELHAVFNRDITKVVDWARAMQLNLYELHNGINPSEIALRNIEFDMTSVANTANQLRNILDVSIRQQKNIKGSRDIVFEYWRDCLYNIGVYVFKEAFKDDSVSGFCVYDDEFPVICINNSLAHSRQIFTLFHEIYHLIKRNSGVDLTNVDVSSLNNESEEWCCHEFAGSFLVPTDDFANVINGTVITDERIEEWSDLYSVSRQVVLRRLLEMRHIDFNFYLDRNEQYKKDYERKVEIDTQGNKKGGGNYYSTQAAYKGKHYLELTYSRYYQKQINLMQLSQYLNMKIHTVRELAARKGWGEI